MAKKAAVLFTDGFEEVEAITPVDILRRAGVETVVAGVGTKEPTGAHGIRVHADVGVDDLAGDLDLLVLPGGMPGAKRLGASVAARALAELLAADGRLIGAICAAPVYTLAAWGFLAGRSATCYPGMESEFPKDVRFRPDPVVADGNFITSRGVGTALDFSLALVAALFGGNAANEMARKVVILSAP
ncbi:MAG: DJ-1/PfpI family protein [Planctomycetota bacterium]|jgi:4-methyl-5(b-hydroxyethyl)-thiazole monophosphate biosynthesis|nr:DJ-1/PfpI family protein [Planctomycetota bacterium]